MDPPKISYIDHNSIMVINPSGKMKQLFVPFKVQCIYPGGRIEHGSKVFVEQVASHEKYKILYRIFQECYPFNCFSIS